MMMGDDDHDHDHDHDDDDDNDDDDDDDMIVRMVAKAMFLKQACPKTIGLPWFASQV